MRSIEISTGWQAPMALLLTDVVVMQSGQQGRCGSTASMGGGALEGEALRLNTSATKGAPKAASHRKTRGTRTTGLAVETVSALTPSASTSLKDNTIEG